MYPSTQLFIAGRWTASASGETLPVTDPATGETIGTVAKAGEPDMAAALAAAQAGFATWRAVAPFDRARILRSAADNLRQRAGTIARQMTMEQGKPLREAQGETMAAADILDWFAEEAKRTYGRIIPARQPGVTQMLVKEPVGPVAAFTPWNFPLNQAVRKVAAALAAGCSVILKGPEETPASPAELVRALADAGVPEGAVNLLFGDPAEISSRLIADPIVRKVSFTGSTAVGKQLAALAGQHMKRVTMELGGHAPVIVAADADVEAAVGVMAPLKFRNAGQVCIAPTRFLIEEPVYDAFVERFAQSAAALNVGSGLDDAHHVGALANPRRLDAMQDLTADAIRCGAHIAAGGKRHGNIGTFFEPTVLAGVPIGARAMNEEPFGPMALMTPVPTLDAALTEANRLNVGLAAYAFTGSAAKAGRLNRELAAGMISVNHYGLGLPELPFGGILDSGFGTEGGADAILAYMNDKFVTQLE